MLGAINRNVSYKSEEVVTKLYCAYIRPHLEYCVQAWSPTYEKDCWLLERVQKRATKMIQGLSCLPYEDRLERLDMFSLRFRRLRGDLIEAFKFTKEQHPGYLKGMFEINRVTRGRGHHYKLVMKQSRTRLRQSFFSRRAVGHCNGLPEEVVAAETLASFKTRLDKHFVERDWLIRTHGTSYGMNTSGGIWDTYIFSFEDCSVPRGGPSPHPLLSSGMCQVCSLWD